MAQIIIIIVILSVEWWGRADCSFILWLEVAIWRCWLPSRFYVCVWAFNKQAATEENTLLGSLAVTGVHCSVGWFVELFARWFAFLIYFANTSCLDLVAYTIGVIKITILRPKNNTWRGEYLNCIPKVFLRLIRFHILHFLGRAVIILKCKQ